MIGTIIFAFVAGLLVVLLGSVFDKTPGNQYAWMAGGLVALLIILLNLDR